LSYKCISLCFGIAKVMLEIEIQNFFEDLFSSITESPDF